MTRIERSFRKVGVGLAGLVSCGLAGCAAGRPSQPAHLAAPPVACGPGIAGEETLAAPLVLVGEVHGTRETPAAFGDLVCHAAAGRRGETILVGLEIPADEQAAIDSFLAGEDGSSVTRALLAQEFWQRDYQDGRSSQAELDLLGELRRQRKAGVKLVVRGLDPPSYGSAGDRDAAMAATLIAAINAVHPARTLVLVGNVHSRILNGYPWDPKAAYVPLGALLRARYGDLIALDVKNLGGSAWTCTSAAAKDCGAHDLRHRESTGPTPRVELDPASASDTGYTGALFLGPVTAAPPARLGVD